MADSVLLKRLVTRLLILVLAMFAFGFALVPITAEDYTWVANAAMAVAVVLTVVSGIQYVIAGSRAVTTSGSPVS